MFNKAYNIATILNTQLIPAQTALSLVETNTVSWKDIMRSDMFRSWGWVGIHDIRIGDVALARIGGYDSQAEHTLIVVVAHKEEFTRYTYGLDLESIEAAVRNKGNGKLGNHVMPTLHRVLVESPEVIMAHRTLVRIESYSEEENYENSRIDYDFNEDGIAESTDYGWEEAQTLGNFKCSVRSYYDAVPHQKIQNAFATDPVTPGVIRTEIQRTKYRNIVEIRTGNNTYTATESAQNDYDIEKLHVQHKAEHVFNFGPCRQTNEFSFVLYGDRILVISDKKYNGDIYYADGLVSEVKDSWTAPCGTPRVGHSKYDYEYHEGVLKKIVVTNHQSYHDENCEMVTKENIVATINFK